MKSKQHRHVFDYDKCWCGVRHESYATGRRVVVSDGKYASANVGPTIPITSDVRSQ